MSLSRGAPQGEFAPAWTSEKPPGTEFFDKAAVKALSCGDAANSSSPGAHKANWHH